MVGIYAKTTAVAQYYTHQTSNAIQKTTCFLFFMLPLPQRS